MLGGDSNKGCMPREGEGVVVRQGRSIAVVGTFLIGCAFLLLVVGCAGTSSEAPKEGQGHTEATNKEQTRSPEATASEEARCEGTRTTKIPDLAGGTYITNDLPGCPKGGLLEGTDKRAHRVDMLAGKDGDDKIRGLGGGDALFGGPGSDVIYGGPGGDRPLFSQEGDDVIYGGPGNDWPMSGDEGEDVIYGGDGRDRLSGLQPPLSRLPAQRDELYCGKGRDTYEADKLDYVDSSCEKKQPLGSQA
jgi:hypothetical protein